MALSFATARSSFCASLVAAKSAGKQPHVSTRTATPQSERWLRDAGRGDNVIGARVPESGSRHTRRGFVSPDLRALAVVRVAIGLQAGAQNDLRPALRLDDLFNNPVVAVALQNVTNLGALSLSGTPGS